MAGKKQRMLELLNSYMAATYSTPQHVQQHWQNAKKFNKLL